MKPRLCIAIACAIACVTCVRNSQAPTDATLHEDEALHGAGERLGIAAADRTLAGNGEDIFGHLPAAVMLRLENVGVSCRGPARLFDGGEDVNFLELTLVIVLAEAAEELGRAHKRLGRDAAQVRADLRHGFAVDEEKTLVLTSSPAQGSTPIRSWSGPLPIG